MSTYENETEQENAAQGDISIARKILFEVLGQEKFKDIGLLTGTVPAIVEAMQRYVSVVMQCAPKIRKEREAADEYEAAQEWVSHCYWGKDEKADAGLIISQVRGGFYNSFLQGWRAAVKALGPEGNIIKLLEAIMAEPGDMNPKKHAARRLLGVIKYPDIGDNVVRTPEGCQCDTEEKRWSCSKDCINKPKIVRS